MLIRPQLLTIIILILLNPFLYLYILIPELANFFLKKKKNISWLLASPQISFRG